MGVNLGITECLTLLNAQRISQEKTLPRPSWLSTQIRPPISSINRLAMASPNPVPPYFPVIEGSACVNFSKIVNCFSGAIPIPVSLTENCKTSPALVLLNLSTRIAIPPVTVNLITLEMMLIRIWRKCVGSPKTDSGTSRNFWNVRVKFFGRLRGRRR